MKISWIILLFCQILLYSQCRMTKPFEKSGTELQIGIIADCQYADQESRGVRNYKLSKTKLEECVDSFNRIKLTHVFHLGDFIDDGGMNSVNVVLPIINSLNALHSFILGNHDYAFPDSIKENVPGIFGLKSRYYTVKIESWKFIILDGNDISLFAWPLNSKEHLSAQKLYNDKYNGQATYNGAIGAKQLKWLEKELEAAQKLTEKIILLCHYPLLPEDVHVLWNSDEILELISNYSCVKAWFNGHNHEGGYQEYQGVHFLTFKGMVNTKTNAFATINLNDERLMIEGFGREVDRKLILRN